MKAEGGGGGGGGGIVSYPDPTMIIAYSMTSRKGNTCKVVRNCSSATKCCCTNQIAAKRSLS